MILDDDSDMLEEQMTHLVKTTFNDGILTKHYIQIDNFFTKFKEDE